MKNIRNIECLVSKQTHSLSEVRIGASIRYPILDLIKKDFPDFTEGAYISIEQLDKYHQKYSNQYKQTGGNRSVSFLEQIIKSFIDHETLFHRLFVERVYVS